MKTQNTKLVFKKDSVVELNEKDLNDVKGGSTFTLIVIPLVTTLIKFN